MSVFITGDTHRDFSKFRKGAYPELDKLTKEDYVIICGDFGGVWDGSRLENRLLDWLDMRPYTVLFVTGNHENYDLLKEFPEAKWNGGKVQYIRPSVIHLMRGQIYNISGKSFFTMGGASSHDIDDGILEPSDPDVMEKLEELDAAGALYRINHLSWWEEELPNAKEYETARNTLDRADWTVDYIVTHCCPTPIQQKLREDMATDALTDFFNEIRTRCKFKYWFFGHYHSNLIVEKKFILLYDQIIQVL